MSVLPDIIINIFLFIFSVLMLLMPYFVYRIHVLLKEMHAQSAKIHKTQLHIHAELYKMRKGDPS